MRKAYVVRVIAVGNKAAAPTAMRVRLTKFRASKSLKLAPRKDAKSEWDIGAEA